MESTNSFDATHLLRATKRFRNELDASLKNSELHACQFFLLNTLQAQGGMTQGALSTHTGIDRTALVGLIDELEEKNCVTRNEIPEDRRANLIELTSQGRQLLEQSRVSFDNFQNTFFRELSSDEKQVLNRLLEKLL